MWSAQCRRRGRRRNRQHLARQLALGARRQSDGVLHGIRAFLPHIRSHGEGGHFVNTASMAGMDGGLGFSPYTASKFAVVGMSEGLSEQLKPHASASACSVRPSSAPASTRAAATGRSVMARR